MEVTGAAFQRRLDGSRESNSVLKPSERALPVHGEGYTPLHEYAVIGNCRTAALVSLRGSIDWFCLPHFSGSAVFAALLEQSRGGRFRICPLDVVSAQHRYIENTNVLETTYQCRTGRLRLIDFMTISPEAACATAPQPQHELVRIAECIEGNVELDALYQPRPADGRHTPGLTRRGALGWSWMHKGIAAYLHSDLDFELSGDGTLAANVTMRAGDRKRAVFTACGNEAVVIHPLTEIDERLQQTIDWWQRWAKRCRYEGAYRAAVVRSCLTLKLLTYCLSGAMVAAPTTSLPERDSGGGNWDYRYCWLRDSSMVLMSFVELGFDWEGRAFLEWLLHATKLTQPKLQVVYDIFGETKLGERELPHLEGYRGVGPVRVGNAAHEQVQLDVYGEVVLAAYCYITLGGRLDRYERKLVAGFGEVVRKMWRCPDQSIWEIRGPPRHYTYSKLMCWVALDRIVKLHRLIGLGIDEQAFRSDCDRIRADIEANGYNSDLGSYVGFYGGSEPDATLLLLARHEYIAHDDPRMLSTCRHIEKHLAVDGFLYRYPPGGSYDGAKDPEHLFGACTFWLVEYLAGLGKIDDATRCFERLLDAATHLGLYAEEFEVRTKGPVGNFPQAFTHVGLIRAALALDAANQRTGKRAS
jgi:GH15 family glucan-1,4-alpha-glucosidase